MIGRLMIVVSCFIAGAVCLTVISRTEAVPLREPLETFPMQIGQWTGERLDLEAATLANLGVDDYLDRAYVTPDQSAVALYIGYYQSQREGDFIHSPLNCLPGAGWSPLSHDRIRITTGENGHEPLPADPTLRGIEVNRYVVQKGLDRRLVLYWYQSHGRVVASEYWGKFYLVADALRMNRTDVALVRVISPINGQDQASNQAAERLAVHFVRLMFPLLDRYLPA